jgi:methyl coenzyme M reductase gamma subunit
MLERIFTDDGEEMVVVVCDHCTQEIDEPISAGTPVIVAFDMQLMHDCAVED